MSTIDEMFADVPKEGTSIEDVLKESVPESQPEKEPEVEQPVAGDIPTEDTPFHKHPRWIERENELQELRQRDEQTARELAELKAFKEETTRRLEPQDTSVPSWFSRLYGENVEAYREYVEHERARTEEIEARILERQEANRKKEAEQAEYWSKWVEGEVQKLQDSGATFDRNKLDAIMLEYRPTDTNNNLDFQAGYKIYQALEGKQDTARSETRKQIADIATKTSKGEPPKKDYMTPADLRNRSMMSL